MKKNKLSTDGSELHMYKILVILTMTGNTYQVCNLCQIYHGIYIVVALNKGQTPFLSYSERFIKTLYCSYKINYKYKKGLMVIHENNYMLTWDYCYWTTDVWKLLPGVIFDQATDQGALAHFWRPHYNHHDWGWLQRCAVHQRYMMFLSFDILGPMLNRVEFFFIKKNFKS